MSKILVAIDFSDAFEKVIKEAEVLAKALCASVTLLHVVVVPRAEPVATRPLRIPRCRSGNPRGLCRAGRLVGTHIPYFMLAMDVLQNHNSIIDHHANQ